MSKLAVALWILVSAMLAMVAAALMFQSGGPGTGGVVSEGEALLGFDPARIDEVRVRRPGAALTETIRRNREGGWSLTMQRSDDADGPEWPVNPVRMRGLLSALSRLRASEQPQTAGETFERQTLSVELLETDGTRHTIRIDSAALGGKRLAQVNASRRAFVDDEIYDVFTSPGPTGWRIESAMPGVGADASRLVAEAPRRRLALARINNRWSLRSPFRARADDNAAARLLDVMSDLRIQRFIDDPTGLDADATGLDDPILTLRAEVDSRTVDDDGEMRTTTEVRELTIGSAADLGGGAYYARTGRSGMLLQIDAEGLQSLSLDPADYVSKLAIGEPASNIGMIVVEPETGADLGYRRGERGWVRLGPDRSPAPSAEANELVALLTEESASASLFSTPTGFEPAGRIMVLDFNEQPLVRLEYGVDGEGFLILHNLDEGGEGGVFRLYDAENASLLMAEADQPASS